MGVKVPGRRAGDRKKRKGKRGKGPEMTTERAIELARKDRHKRGINLGLREVARKKTRKQRMREGGKRKKETKKDDGLENEECIDGMGAPDIAADFGDVESGQVENNQVKTLVFKKNGVVEFQTHDSSADKSLGPSSTEENVSATELNKTVAGKKTVLEDRNSSVSGGLCWGKTDWCDAKVAGEPFEAKKEIESASGDKPQFGEVMDRPPEYLRLLGEKIAAKRNRRRARSDVSGEMFTPDKMRSLAHLKLQAEETRRAYTNVKIQRNRFSKKNQNTWRSDMVSMERAPIKRQREKKALRSAVEETQNSGCFKDLVWVGSGGKPLFAKQAAEIDY